VYMDDTNTTRHDYFNDGTLVSIFVVFFVPSSTAGQFDMGSTFAVWMPNCEVLEETKGDQNGLLTDELSFRATRGSDGSTEEMYIGVI